MGGEAQDLATFQGQGTCREQLPAIGPKYKFSLTLVGSLGYTFKTPIGLQCSCFSPMKLDVRKRVMILKPKDLNN